MNPSLTSISSGSTVSLRGHGLTGNSHIELTEELLELDLRDNALQSVPSQVLALKQLTSLYLGRNILTELPSLQHLRVLDISDNRLTNLRLHGMANLRVLNASGNRIGDAAEILGLKDCTSLKVLSLARNQIVRIDSLLDSLQGLPLAVLDVLGNSLDLNPRTLELRELVIFNGSCLDGQLSQVSRLPVQEANSAGVWWNSGSLPSSGGGRILPMHSSSRDIPRPAPLAIRDSAGDELPVREATGNSSVSEFESAYDPESHAEPSSVSAGLGLVERQDSANYQPRPPALTERQDSAQNLQALAEEEAAYAALTEMTLVRQDSAHELDDLSPHSRRTGSTGLPSREGMESAEGPSSSSAPSGWALGSPSQGNRVSTGSPFLTTSLRSSSPLSIKRASDELMSPEAEPSASLEAARQLMKQPLGSYQPCTSSLNSVSSNFLVRQDSASNQAEREDSGNRDFLTSPRTSSLLQQARQMMDPTSLEGRQEHTASPSILLFGRASRQESSSLPLSSPYDQPISPLSPEWTAACMEDQQPPSHMPSIVSGHPWTIPSTESTRSPVGNRGRTVLGTSPPAKSLS